MNERGFYPMETTDGDEFGYDARVHAWVLNGQILSDEEAEPVYKQKMEAWRAAQGQDTSTSDQ